jgi:hypothetical protein
MPPAEGAERLRFVRGIGAELAERLRIFRLAEGAERLRIFRPAEGAETQGIF